MPFYTVAKTELEVHLSDGRVFADGDLSIGINAFSFEVQGAKYRYDGVASQAVTNDATNYVYIDNTGSLALSTSGWPDSNHLRLARVVAASGLINQIIDERAILVANINREINKESSEVQSDTTSTDWQQKVRCSIEGLSAGKYIIEWYAEIKHSNTDLTNYTDVRIEADDTTELGTSVWPFPAWNTFGGLRVVDLGSGNHDLDIDYRVQGGGTAYIRRARILLWRIS